jgi:hypothetical protein
MSSPTIAEAAEVANVSERSLYRWLAEDIEYRAELSRAEGGAISDASRRLASLMSLAVETLEVVMSGSEASPSAKSRASQLVLEYGSRLHELGVIETRLRRLEERVLFDEHQRTYRTT